MIKRLFLFTSLITILLSCDTKQNKLILKSSTGRINSILIVIENAQWHNAIGDTLRTYINEPVAGLPQPESQFRITQISPKKFNSLFENYRNILIVGTAKKRAFKIVNDKYASPQKIITLTGLDQKDLIKQINLHYDEIKRAFNQSDLALYQYKLSKKVWDNKKLLALNNLKIVLPKKYMLVENKKEFLWLRKHLAKDGTLNILAYTMPLPKDNTLTQKIILSKRDSIGKKYIPGQLLNSYMQTSYELNPVFKPVKFNNLQAFDTRGIWDVKNDFMGGAFINYAIVDKKNNRVICLDGFVYAPNQDKRDYIFELEAIFKTLKIQ